MKKIYTLFLVLFYLNGSSQIISTICGTSIASYSGDGGQATAAQLSRPNGVAIDTAGNIFIADTYNHRVRKIAASTGIITTVAGTGTAGFSGDGGAATSAMLNNPAAITVDLPGNLYIADEVNHRVRKVNTSGIISTIAGNGTAGYSGDGSAATSASLKYPLALTLDAANNVYVIDYGNHAIRKISGGIITTIAGTGTAGYNGDGITATSAQLSSPYSVLIDASGLIYIGDAGNSRIRTINAAGIINTFAGTGSTGYSGDGGLAISAQISGITGMCFSSSGELYVICGQTVRKIDAGGIISRYAGIPQTPGYSGDGGPATFALLRNPTAIAFNKYDELVMADQFNNRVRRITYCASAINVTSTGRANACGGGVDTLIASGAATYTWSANAGASNSYSVMVAPTTNIDYTVTGSTGTCAAGSVFSVYTHPLVSITASPTVCAGSALILTANGASSYTWSANAGSVTTATASVSPSSNTTYTVIGDSSGCKGSATAFVSIVASPTVYVNSSPATLCSGNSAVLSSSGAITYTWSANAGGLHTANVTVSPTVTTVYTVTGSNTSGCSSSRIYTLTVNPVPSVSVTSTSTLCPGTHTMVVASGATGYNWYTQFGWGGNNDTLFIIVNTNTSYTVTGQTGSCSKTVTGMIPVHPFFVTAPGSFSICAGDTTSLSASGANTYTWLPGNIANSSIQIMPSSTTSYSVIGTDGTCTDTASLTVTVNNCSSYSRTHNTCYENTFSPSFYDSYYLGGNNLAPGDFDNDGDMDLFVSTSGGPGELVLNDGAGRMGAPAYINDAMYANQVAKDLNNDGKLDLIQSDGDLRVFLNLGGGNFHDSAYNSSPNYVRDFVSEDFNGDGFADYAGVEAGSSGTIEVRFNNGAGKFGSPTYYPSSYYSGYLIAGDFNGDSKIDLIKTNAGNQSVAILYNNGSGAFSTTATYSISSYFPMALAAADFNNDSKLDLAIADNASKLFICLNNGSGTFGPAVQYSFSGDGTVLQASDMDGDSYIDLLGVNKQTNLVSVNYNNGNGIFAAPVYFRVAHWPIALKVADFDNDGKQDITVVTKYSHEVCILFNAGGRTFGEASNFTVSKPGGVVAADFDMDGQNDFAVTEYNNNVVDVFHNNGSGSFTRQCYMSTGTNPTEVFTGDFNNDDLPDLVTLNYNSSNITVFLNGGPVQGWCSFSSANYNCGANPASLNIDDYNGDGYPDLFVGAMSNTYANVFINNGAGGFTNTATYTLSAASISLVKGDFNGDNKTDIVALYITNDSLVCLYNSGTGTFPTRGNLGDGLPYGFSVADMITTDLNADGNKDILVTGWDPWNDSIFVFIGKPGGGLYPHKSFPITEAGNMHAADLNKDGKSDVVLTGMSFIGGMGTTSSNAVGIVLGDGTGGLTESSSFVDGAGSDRSEVADMNGDGNEDLLLPYDTAMVSIYYNENALSSMFVSGAQECCSAIPITLTASGSPSYSWSTGASGQSIVVTPTVTTTYTVVGSNAGCGTAFVKTIHVEKCVWPGDADYDLSVTSQDLMPVGLYYGYTGKARDTISNSYSGHFCKDWNQVQSNSINMKHVDCNGDSTIDMNDTLAICLNFGNSHPARYEQPGVIQVSNPDIYLIFDRSQYAPGDTVNADVYIGSSAAPQNNFYGTAFKINYDETKMQTGTERFTFYNSWVGNLNQQQIKFSRINPAGGLVDGSQVRICHTDTVGYGKTATFRFVLANPQPSSMLYFTINDAIKTDAAGNSSLLLAGTDSVPVINGNTSALNTSVGFTIVPNPADQFVCVSGLGPKSEIKLIDQLGQVVRQIQTSDRIARVDLVTLPSGIYLLSVADEKRIYEKKIIINH